MSKTRENAIIITVLVIILILRIPYITQSPYEQGERWRQSDTESIARNFVEYRFNIFYPQFNYDGPMPNYVQLEFQITTYIIAVLYKIFGYKYIIARTIPLLFFMGSSIFLYLIAGKFYPFGQSIIVLFLYGLFPITIFFSRAIMPESSALFFYLGAFYFFLRWIEKETKKDIITSAMFTALAISQKIPTIFIGIAMLIIAFKKYKMQIFKIGELYIFTLISLFLPFTYFQWMKYISEFKFVNDIANKHIFTRLFYDFLTKESIEFFKINLPQGYTIQVLVLFLIGLIMIDVRKEMPVLAWIFAMILEVIMIVAVIRLYYYLIFISPLIALIASKPLYIIWENKYGGVFISLIIMWIGYTAFRGLLPFYIEKTELIKQAGMVKKYTDKEDLIVVGTPDPALINACERRGWRANIDYYSYIPKDPIREIEYYIESGAKYFVPMKGWIHNDKGEYKSFLDSNFEKIIGEDGYYIYKLR
ncbi:MAG: dolichyl-phosphate-mannose--protein mannosyltransferase [Epulopiscium sp.]|nr:dolichyl-phosphate-mannose--protein mannosyltransferase [Candidatus Epulonipiscium sp.]